MEQVKSIFWDGGDGEDMNEFTPVVSKSARKRMRAANKVTVRGAQSKSSAASGKISINHPLCDVLVGPGTESKIQNINDRGYLELQECREERDWLFFCKFS